MRPRASVLWFPSTNCHWEMMHAFEVAGADPKLVLLNRLLQDRERLSETDLLGIPGGFSFGDHFGAGRVAAFDLTRRLLDQLQELRERQVPMLGICNGFQILVASGLIPGDGPIGTPTGILDLNRTARFEHWYRTTVVLHSPRPVDCVWIRGMDGISIRIPSAHGEGVPMMREPLQSSNIVGTYGTYEGIDRYPSSPNGSSVAGICDSTGTIAGFMPHPERRVDELRGGTDGLRIFQSGVSSVR